jgi:hypothetical protein
VVQVGAVSGHLAARALIYTHRWLGIAIGFFFLLWFASGLVMIYARMPVLEHAERLARLQAIAPASIRFAPPHPDGEISRFVIATIEGRPIYRITAGGRTQHTFADSGDPAPPVDADQAVRIASSFASVGTARHDARLTDADQWTFHVRRQMPLHRIAIEDEQATRLYVAEQGGEVVTKTTATGRRWGWVGAVIHWLYFTPFRRHSGLWSNTIILLSTAGTLMCIVGMAWGVWRLSPLRRYRLRDHQQWTPYASAMRWHHYLGLIFGATTTMWVFSGLLSMDPWNWSPSTTPTREQQLRLAGGAIAAPDLTLERVRRAVEAFKPRMAKEIEVVRFRGRYYAAAAEGIVSFDEPQLGVQEQLPPDLVIGAARLLMPDSEIAGMHWMEDYDAYYYDRDRQRTLPVLRVRYNDPQQTWLYIDPRKGVIARKGERLSRINRWLYHGFHSFDFPWLYYRRPLWDIVVITLSAGGILLSVMTMSAGWRRVKRNIRGIRASNGS